MLQIVTKMYFREGVPLHSTVQRDVVYTNRGFLRSGAVSLPVGELAPSTAVAPVSSVTISVTEHLEAEELDGQPAVLVATSGALLIDQLADVVSFGLNAVFSRDHDLVRNLVPRTLDGSSAASKLFRHTFEPHRYVPDTELDEFRLFMTQLLALNRDHYEAAMRAIRRIARATQRAIDDPTLAYVDLVAAIESLTEGVDVPAPPWERLDGAKRRLIDDALEGAGADVAERVRAAVLEAERAGAKSRFVAFVQDNITPEYFRAEAVDAVRPIHGADLERAVKLAYDIRSRNVHVLEDLPPEAWVIGDQAETVSPPGMGTMLSLEGLARLARHVVRSYVDRAPTELDTTFDWRASLPGQLRLRWAPQYWVWIADQFHHRSADRYFAGFVEHLTGTIAGSNPGVPDMRAVLERIENLLPGTADGPVKTLMVAIYILWHRVLEANDHRPDAAKLIAQNEHLLQRADVPSFVVGLLSNRLPEWTDDEWHALATNRREERMRRGHVELPAGIDAALQAMAADRMLAAGRTDDARTLARFAVEELPGDERLMAWESHLVADQPIELDLRAIVLQLSPAAEGDDNAKDQSSDDGADDGDA